jgi:cobalt-zinc-cadmium efflux system membrane fusion protein
MVKLPIAAGMTVLAAAIGFGAARGLLPQESAQQGREAPAVLEAKAETRGTNAPETLKIPQNYLAVADIAVEQVEWPRRYRDPGPCYRSCGARQRGRHCRSRLGCHLENQPTPGDAVKAGEALALVNSMDAASMAAEKG